MGKMANDILSKFESIEVQKISDIVLEKIRELILNGTLKPEDHLPSERDLADKFGVGRGHVREAIKKLEFYGIVKTFPQSGTVVANQGIPLLEHMITNIIKLEKGDKWNLMETREILEINAASLAAERADKKSTDKLKKSLDDHYQAVKAGGFGLNEDLVFHLKIAELSNNTVLQSMLMLIVPQVHRVSEMARSCRDGRAYNAWLEHKKIYDAIQKQDQEGAAEAMKYHLSNAIKSFQLKNNLMNK